MKHEADLDALWDAVDEVDGLEVDERRRRLPPLIERARVLCEVTSSPQSYYVWGYASYVHPDRRTDRDLYEVVESALHRCLALDPGFVFAALYLGYNAYDVGAYGLAAERFDAVDVTSLEPYMALKAHEMLVCARVMRDGSFAGHHASLSHFVDRCRAFDLTDVNPLSLSAAVGELRERNVALDDTTCELLLQIDVAAQHAWFAPYIGPYTGSP